MSQNDLEFDRRLANLIRVGTVAAIDEAGGFVKVDLGDVKTDWLRWGERRAGPGQRTWAMPEVGEQVMVLSPSGDLSQGVVGHSLPQAAHKYPASSKEKDRREFGDGAHEQYDRQAHKYHLDVPAGGSITLHIGGTTLLLEDGKVTVTTGSLKVDAPQSTFTGAVTVQGLLAYQNGLAGKPGANGSKITGDFSITGGDVKADAISLKGHKHSGVQTGSGTTGTPT